LNIFDRIRPQNKKYLIRISLNLSVFNSDLHKQTTAVDVAANLGNERFRDDIYVYSFAFRLISAAFYNSLPVYKSTSTSLKVSYSR